MKYICKFALSASGDSPIEKAFALFRHHCGVIANRVKTIERCRRCFHHGWIKKPGRGKHSHDIVHSIKFGCDGCAEMHDFINAARELFAAESNGGEA